MDKKTRIKNSFDKWLFLKWHFWVLILVHLFLTFDVPSPLTNIGETIGSIFGSFLVVLIPYGIYYLIKRPNK